MTVPLAKHSLREPVAFPVGGASASEVRSAQDLLGDAARVAERLPPASAGSHVLLAVTQDRYAFATGLLGAWWQGHSVALPPHTGLAPILRLSQRGDVVAVVHDTITQAPLRIDQLLAEPLPEAAPRIVPETIPELAVTLYTEGPDGEMRGWPKRRHELLGEAQSLAELFGFGPGLRVASTLPPCTQFGLVLGVLVPLISGGALLREVLTGPTGLERWQADVLVSIPAHLRRLPAATLGRFAKVFSSRAPLSGLSGDIIDVFGTTATGSVAFRAGPAEGRFQPLPGVQVGVDPDGHLLVQPAGSSSRAVRCQDRVEVGAAGFQLLGRADEPEQTLEARELEVHLLAIEGVEDAVVVAAPSSQQLLAAVVAPGWDEPRLREALGASGESVQLQCLPRIWRGGTGKPRRGHVFQLFGRRRDGRPLTFELIWQGESASRTDSSEQRSYRARLPEDYGYFEGHFAGYPILPGAAQLSDLILPCVRRARPELGRFSGMSRVKFLDRIEPGQSVEVVLTWQSGASTLEFALRREQIVCAAGRLTFQDSAAS